MKTRYKITIGIIIAVAVYLPIHYYYPFLGIGSTTETFIFCEEGLTLVNGECVPLRPSPLFPEPEPELEIETKTKQLGINNIMKAIDSEDLSYDEKLEYIKFRYEQDPDAPPSLNLRIKDLPRELEEGERPTFTLIESGYANPCTAPKLEVYLIKGERGLFIFGEDEPLFEHRIVYSCPKFFKFYPVLNYWDEQDFPLFPDCSYEGTHVIVGDSGTERYALDEYYCNSLQKFVSLETEPSTEPPIEPPRSTDGYLLENRAFAIDANSIETAKRFCPQGYYTIGNTAIELHNENADVNFSAKASKNDSFQGWEFTFENNENVEQILTVYWDCSVIIEPRTEPHPEPEPQPETMSEGIPNKKFAPTEESFDGVFGIPITESEFKDVINYEPVKLHDLSEIIFNGQKLVLFEIRINPNTDIHYLYAPQTMKLNELKNKQDFFDSGGVLVKTVYLTNPTGVYQRLANDPSFEIEYLGTVPIRYHLYEEFNSLLSYPENERLVYIQTIADINKIKQLASSMKLKNDSLNLDDYVMTDWKLEEPKP